MTATAIAIHIVSDKGQRRFRSVVGAQTDWALPVARPAIGNSGEGLTVFVAAVMRLSQNTSSAFEPAAAGGGLRGAGFLCAAPFCSSSGALGNRTVAGRSQTPVASLRTTASLGVAAIWIETFTAKTSSIKSILSTKGPMP